MAPHEKKLHPHAMEVIFEKFILLSAPRMLYVKPEWMHHFVDQETLIELTGDFTEPKPPTTPITSQELFKLMLLSKACSRSFGHAFRLNFRLGLFNDGAWVGCKKNGPLQQLGEYACRIKSNWMAMWMIKKGLGQYMEIGLLPPDDKPTYAQPNMSHDESPLESLARLFFTDERDFKMLNIKSLAKQMALPPVYYCKFEYWDLSNTSVLWTMLNRLFNFNAEKMFINPEHIESDSGDSTLNENILANATKKVDYWKTMSEKDYDFGTECFDNLAPWKKMLLHTCRICPNLEKLQFMLWWGYLPNQNSIDRHFEKLDSFIDWAFEELLPEMTENCRFIPHMHIGCRRDDDLRAQLITRMEELAQELNFIAIEEEHEGRYMKRRSTDDHRFELDFSC